MTGVFHFLPWLQLEETLRIDDLTFDHYHLQRWSESARTEAELKIVPRLLGNYQTIVGRNVERCTVIRQNGELFANIDESEFQRRKKLVHRLCFSALAAREFFRTPTWNSSYFADYAQRFEGEHNFLTVVSRRREGSQLAAHPADALRFTQPFQAAQPSGKVHTDLLDALANARSKVDEDEWRRIETAMYFFNEANSDRDDVPVVRELVDMFTAFECLFDERNNADRLAHKVAESLKPNEALLTSDSTRAGLSAKGGSSADRRSVRFQWMRDLSNCRDNIAHGRVEATSLWRHDEHVVVAAIAFPLLVKTYLSNLGLYSMTDADRAQIDAFERMADADFMVQPADARHSEDFVWSRLQAQFYRHSQIAKFVEAELARRSARKKDQGDDG